MNRHSCVWGVLVLSSIGCGGNADQEESAATTSEAIVRGVEDYGHTYTVMLHMERHSGQLTWCSGVYVAPRVVLTAAHCLHDDTIPERLLVYYGTQYQEDSASLADIPAPGQPSVWARAENWERHPSYDPATLHPDVGVVFLDRPLPMAPAHLARFRLGDAWNGFPMVAVGWGANVVLGPDLSDASGYGVRRSGIVQLLGSPTEADYHPDDPNPGMLDPAVRADMLKTNGAAPWANSCAGDSGGPLVARIWGQDYVGGVSSFTGLSCSDYALYSRIDPVLPFLDEAFQRGGRMPIVPRLQCVDEQTDGRLLAYFGYDNENAVTVAIPKDGFHNVLCGDSLDMRPSAFLPGDHPWVFSVSLLPSQRLSYRLVPPSGPRTNLVVSASSPRCDRASAGYLAAKACEASAAAHCGESFATCTEYVLAEYSMLDLYGIACKPEWEELTSCLAALTPEGFTCEPGTPMAYPKDDNCAEQSMAYITCLGF